MILSNHKLVLQAFSGRCGPDTIWSTSKYIKEAGKAGYVSALNDPFAGHSDAQLAKMLLDITGLNGIELGGDGDTDATSKAVLSKAVWGFGTEGNRTGGDPNSLKVTNYLL